MPVRFVQGAFLAAAMLSPALVFAQTPAPPLQQQQQTNPAPATPAPTQTAQSHAAVRISLDQAIQMAVDHNHNLKAAQTTILQNQAQEITANLRPNPTLTLGEQYFPFFQPNSFTWDYLENNAEFDVGLSYLFERGKKRQHRLQA